MPEKKLLYKKHSSIKSPKTIIHPSFSPGKSAKSNSLDLLQRKIGNNHFNKIFTSQNTIQRKEEEQPKLIQRKEEEQAKLIQCKEEEQAKLIQRKEEEQPKLIQRKEEEQSKLIQRKEEEQAKLIQCKEEEQSKLIQRKEEEQAKLIQCKEEEQAKLIQRKEEEQPKLIQCKEEEQAKLIQRKEEEQPKLIQRKEEEQPGMKVSKPGDKYEVEADNVADKVMKTRNSNPANQHISTMPINTIHRLQAKSNNLMTYVPGAIQKKEKSTRGNVSPELSRQISGQKGLGKPLPPKVKNEMETGFGADFSKVKVHNNPTSYGFNKDIDAQAFTVGNNIFFGQGKFNPESQSGKHLIAHELTHVVQQGGGIKKKDVIHRKSDEEEGDAGALAKKIDSFARNIPGYSLLITIIGYNPVLRRKVPRTPKNFVRGFMGIVPGGEILFQRLDKSGAIDDALQWLESEIAKANISLSAILGELKTVWDSISLWKVWKWGDYIDRFINVFKRPIKALFNLGKAIVSKVAEWVFKGVMRMIAGEQNAVMGIINKGQSVLKAIINDPIKFIMNLVKAVKSGLNRFVKNIWKHLMNGIMGWLFGTFSEAGLELPKKFDVKGIFHLVAQILGLTWKQMRVKIVKRLGPHGEKIMTGLEKTVEFVTVLIKKGPIALWDKIKKELGNLKDMVLGAIIEWVRNTIIVKAIEKLISFFNPAGAIIQAIIAIYNTVMWIYERYQQIKAFVESVINSIASIAMGNIGGAASFIEQSIAKAIPVIISFLARLIGLGGIGKKIQNIIKKIRKPIDKVVNKVLDWIVNKGKKLFGKAKAGAKAVAGKIIQWWKVKKSFKAQDGSSHKLYFKGSAKSSKLMISSNPQTFTEFISSIKIDTSKGDLKQTKEKAVQVAGEIDKKKNERTGASTKEQTKKNEEKKQKDLEDLLTKLSPLSGKLLGVNEADLPESGEPDYGGLIDGFGSSMDIEPLTKKGKKGSTPSATNDIWQTLLKRREGGRSYYIRGHLLNHNVHGPGNDWRNLTVLSQKGNKNHLSAVETAVKIAVDSGSIVRYSVKANYTGSRSDKVKDSDLEAANIDSSLWEDVRAIKKYEKKVVPENLTVSADLVEAEGNGKYKKKKTLVAGKDVPNPVATGLTEYELGNGKAKKNVSITNSSIEDITQNTSFKDNAELVIIQNAAKAVAESESGLNRYQQIIDKLDAEQKLTGKIKNIIDNKSAKKGLRYEKNVTL